MDKRQGQREPLGTGKDQKRRLGPQTGQNSNVKISRLGQEAAVGEKPPQGPDPELSLRGEKESQEQFNRSFVVHFPTAKAGPEKIRPNRVEKSQNCP